MKYVILGLAAITLSGCGAFDETKDASQAAVGTEQTTTQASATVDAFHAAMKAGNNEETLSYLDDNVLIYEGGGAETSKAEYASHHLEADIAFLQGLTQTVTEQDASISGDMALITRQVDASGSYKDKIIDSTTTETMVLRMTGDKWKIVHIHWSSADKNPSTPVS